MVRRMLLLPMAGALLLAGSAQALTISTAIATGGTNSADNKVDTLTDYRENRSSTSLPDSGGTTPDLVGNSVNAQGRYAAMTAADSGIFTNLTRTATHNYSITFTITAPVWTTYDVTINTARIGALTRVDEGSASGNATISALTGTLNAVANGSLGLTQVTLGNGNSAANTPFNQTTPTITLTGLTGNNVITLAFNWTSTTTSSSGLTGGDETAVRLGMAKTTGTGTTAPDYPGVGARVIGNDGHFAGINATITAVPEPGTLLLIGSGIAGLAVYGRRRAD
jgi:hypothetical protein